MFLTYTRNESKLQIRRNTYERTGAVKTDIYFNEDAKTITLYIPHTECGKINIPSDEMEFGDVEHGWLAFGEVNLTPEQMANVETEAGSGMEKKLEDLKEGETADRFAIMSVWEIYQPLVSAVSPEYKLEVKFH